MKITLNQQEMVFLAKAAQRYNEQTGKDYSVQYIMLLLAATYEERLKKDLAKIIDKKILDYTENKAILGDLVSISIE